MTDNVTINNYLEKIDLWYSYNRTENVDWMTLYEMLSEERRLIELNYDSKIEEFYNTSHEKVNKSEVNKLHMRKTLDSFVYRKEELFAYSNHMQNIVYKYVSMLRSNNSDFSKSGEHKKSFSSNVNKMCETTHELLKEKTKVAKKILFIAASIDSDLEKVQSEDKYSKLAESINILETVINGKLPYKKDDLLPVVLSNMEFSPNEFIEDTSDNIIVKFMGDFIETKKKIDANILNITNSIKETKTSLLM
ncbi:MAG TPA: hypothetical protein DEP72_07660 [Clostridiales bacterium]|nr:MAG: hypothetical protein A2Y18_06975 [Clostridiales bacterium GWD2_32_19]HCC08012.1 hypothetical protein [Clostridiales bacterium]